jgi:integrase
MLDLTSHPKPSQTLTYRPQLHTGPTLQNLYEHVARRTNLSPVTRDRYLGAISRSAEFMNKPLFMIAADLNIVELRFPRDGFDPDFWSTQQAYLLFRRRLQASLREFLGIHAEQTRLRAIEDGWTRLLAALEPLTRGRVGKSVDFHPMKREALKAFVVVARSYGWQPWDLTADRAKKMDADFRGNKRDSNRRSLRQLDELRAFPILLPLLPHRAIDFSADRLVQPFQTLNPAWETQISTWTDSVTQTNWDPVERRFADHHVGHAHVLRCALHCAVRLGLNIGAISLDDADLRVILSDDNAMCGIAAEMFARRLRTKAEGHLAPRTSRKYLKAINQVRGKLGIDTALMSQILANNDVAREGKRNDKRMTPKNRKFCETLVVKPHLRRRFLLSFQSLQEAAEAVFTVAAAEKRKLTAKEISQVRLLGASACFAAIAIGGAPIRVKNAMMLTCVGEDAQIRVPLNGTKPIQVRIPAELTKNKREIEFPICHHTSGYYDTIRWYLTTIRPLFCHAAGSPYLFPAVTTELVHMNRSYFGNVFADSMRSIVNLPMTPHQMRHGQTSLLLDKYPNEVEVIAKRIDDKPETLRMYYGWLNALKLVERGQSLLVGLMK